MKVLNVVTSGLLREGISTTQLEYARFVNKEKVQYTMVANEGDSDKTMVEAFEQVGCDVVWLPARKKNGKKGFIKYLKALYQEIKTNGYDVIHVHGSSSIMAADLWVAKLAGVPVRIAHSRNTTCNHALANKMLRPLFNISYNAAFACGEDAGKWLFGKKHFTIIHNGKDLEKFSFSQQTRDRIRKEYSCENKVAVGFVGNLIEQKNPEYLIHIFKEYKSKNPDSILFIMGAGSKRAELEQLALQLSVSDSVVFTGRVSNVHEMLQAMDIMLLPSKWEGLPNVVLEWQAAGLPSLVSDNVTKECKLTDLVEFLPVDVLPEVWADKMCSMDITTRAEKSDDAHIKMKGQGFDIRQNAQDLELVYELLLNNCVENRGKINEH